MDESVLFSVPVELGGKTYQVEVFKTSAKSRKFKGQKILHPYSFDKSTKNVKYNDDDTNSEKLRNVSFFGVKHDGSCGALMWNEETQKWIPYARYDIKLKDGVPVTPTIDIEDKTKPKGKYGYPKIKRARDISAWIECEPMSIDEDATHWPHFVPLSEDPNQYKWFQQAFDKSREEIEKLDPKNHGKIITIEYMGKKINGKPADPIQYETGIVLHNSMGMRIPMELRTFAGFKAIFEKLPIEGLVAYCDDDTIFKIRSDMFGFNWEKMNPDSTKVYGHHGEGMSRDVILKQ